MNIGIILLVLIIGILIGSLCTYVIFRPKLNSIKELHKLDEKTQKQNEQIQKENILNKKEQQELEQKIIILKNNIQSLRDRIQDLNKSAEDSAQIIYQKAMENIELSLDTASEKMSQKYQQLEEENKNCYLKLLKESADTYQLTIKEKQTEIKELDKVLDDYKSKVAATVEANKREQKKKDELNFYRLCLTEEDKQEIKILREISNQLRNKEALNKVIWKVYYEKPYTDLIGRVIGNNKKTGIYKITNLMNGMTYIGQAVDLASRWKQHIKRGVGAETPTRNKLYPAMLAIGVENFSFEVIEECPSEKLNEREQYWQQIYQSKSFGYSIK